MKRRFESYTRLARGIFGVSSLWVGPRDLLYVRGTGVLMPFTEEYIRFELERIQSTSVVQTHTGRVLNIIFGLLTAVGGMVGGIAGWQVVSGAVDGYPAIGLGVVAVPSLLAAAVALLLLILNVALGPTCHFQIQTATRVERVRPVRRLRVARRVMAQLDPVVRAAQGGLAAVRDEPADAGNGPGDSGGSVVPVY